MNKVYIAAGAGGVLLFGVLLGLYLYFVATVAYPAIDAHQAALDRQFLIDQAKCESKGGIAIRSSWDGSLKDCKFPTGVKS